MFDLELAREILKNISESLNKIVFRFEGINSSEDFLTSPAGSEKLDSICMQLIVIGESLKNLDKITENNLLVKYPEIEWTKVKGLRDIISHHYFDVNEDAIFDICNNKIPPLAETIDKMILEL
ncbi:MAG: HepT-like ribonuclease domain-containing protein [Candidatus Delongbacteria bacterium]